MAVDLVGGPGGRAQVFSDNPYLLPLIYALPVVNAVLLVGCAYQVYSFFCVARHFQTLRHRLTALVGRDVLAYEDKFKRTPSKQRELSLALDVVACAMWFVIPITLAMVFAIGAPMWVGFPNHACALVYFIGTFLSIVAGAYLIGVGVLMGRTRTGSAKA